MWIRIFVVLALLASDVCVAETSVQVHGFSGVPHRGANITGNRGVIGGTVSLDSDSGFFVGLSGHYAPGTPTGQRLTRYAGVSAGWFLPIAADRAIELSVSRHIFDDVPDWRYDELRVDYHRTRALTFSGMVSPDYYGRGSESVLTEVRWQPTFRRNWFARFTVGAGLLPNADQRSFAWLEAGAGFARGRFSTLFSVGGTNADSVPSEQVADVTITFQLNYLVR